MLNLLRDLNAPLAVFAVACVGYRLGILWMEGEGLHSDQRRRMFVVVAVLLGYPIASGLGAVQANLLDTPAGPVTILFTLLHLALIGLCAKWPASARETETHDA